MKSATDADETCDQRTESSADTHEDANALTLAQALRLQHSAAPPRPAQLRVLALVIPPARVDDRPLKAEVAPLAETRRSLPPSETARDRYSAGSWRVSALRLRTYSSRAQGVDGTLNTICAAACTVRAERRRARTGRR